MTLAIKAHFSKYKPTFNTDSMQLADALTATHMRMRENDFILGIPKSSYILGRLHDLVCMTLSNFSITGLKRIC